MTAVQPRLIATFVVAMILLAALATAGLVVSLRVSQSGAVDRAAIQSQGQVIARIDRLSRAAAANQRNSAINKAKIAMNSRKLAGNKAKIDKTINTVQGRHGPKLHGTPGARGLAGTSGSGGPAAVAGPKGSRRHHCGNSR